VGISVKRDGSDGKERWSARWRRRAEMGRKDSNGESGAESERQPRENERAGRGAERNDEV
jgi:hypothetical protein